MFFSVANADEQICHVLPTNETTAHVCKFIKHHCDTAEFRYAKYYYCSIPKISTLMTVLSFLAIIAVAIVLFVVLGLLASNYLTPNLTSLSNLLHMNEKLSGLTLLAFANGAPDMFSTYIAMDNGSTALAIGELLGSANFALTVVFGSMMIVRPFKVDYNTFIRDVSLFAVLITISLLFLWDGKIAFWESIALCLLYVCYIILSFYSPEKFIDPEQNSDAIQDEQDPSDGNISDSGSFLSNGSFSNRDPNFERSVENLESGLSLRLSLVDSLKLAIKSMDTKISNEPNEMANSGSLENSFHHSGHFDEENNIDDLLDPSKLHKKTHSRTVSIEVAQELTNGPKIPEIVIDSEITSEDDNAYTGLLQSNFDFPTGSQDHLFVSSSGGSACDMSIQSANSINSQILSVICPEHSPLHEPTLMDKLVPDLAFNRDHPYEFLLTLLTLPLVVPFNLIIPTPPNDEFTFYIISSRTSFDKLSSPKIHLSELLQEAFQLVILFCWVFHHIEYDNTCSK
ncbi:unnamed protein product [Ambrosiozyma monospora]|uniref:Unnamed protein product n=1 Tax=Ambrosiozyma monospora TaxID=43982 RepID=A0ACB5T8G2_AMBMO|nr:unnamed protein product [Ambrosiozyma monospora]